MQCATVFVFLGLVQRDPFCLISLVQVQVIRPQFGLTESVFPKQVFIKDVDADGLAAFHVEVVGLLPHGVVRVLLHGGLPCVGARCDLHKRVHFPKTAAQAAFRGQVLRLLHRHPQRSERPMRLVADRRGHERRRCRRGGMGGGMAGGVLRVELHQQVAGGVALVVDGDAARPGLQVRDAHAGRAHVVVFAEPVLVFDVELDLGRGGAREVEVVRRVPNGVRVLLTDRCLPFLIPHTDLTVWVRLPDQVLALQVVALDDGDLDATRLFGGAFGRGDDRRDRGRSVRATATGLGVEVLTPHVGHVVQVDLPALLHLLLAEA
mmetsp:Transcript_57518/g.92850  ORF Transcript_57518/g.92850 Transcript_57518/m.92850 type:complete len:320 (-) Transcript_57518:864-1823(-)